MKKVLLSLLAVAALVLSCQNYDDEFDALNAKVSSLESQISSLQGLQTALTSVQSSVSALQSAVNAIPDPSSSIAALATSIAEILTDLGALETAVAGATTSTDLDALKSELTTALDALKALIEANSTSIASLVISNADLKTQLEGLGVDVDAVLAANSTFDGNLTITNAAELAYAKSLGSKVGSINGDVIVTVDEPSATANRAANTGNGVTAAEVNTVLSQIKFIVGNVRITTDASLDLSALTTVSGDYSVVGHDIDDSALASVGDDVYVDYDGPVSFPALATADKIYVKGTYVATAAASVATATAAGTLKTGTTSINFMGLTKATSISILNATHTSGGSHTSGSSATINDAGWPAGELYLSKSTTSVKIGQAPVTLVSGAGLTDLELHYRADLESVAKTLALYSGLSSTGSAALGDLSITAPKLVTGTVMARKIGSITVDAVASTATSATGTVSFPEALFVGAITSDALVNTFPKVVTTKGISLANQVSVSLPEMTGSSGDISLPKATSFSAAKLAVMGTASATAPVYKSITADNVTGAVSLPALTQAATLSFEDASSLVAASALVNTAVELDADATSVEILSIGSTSAGSITPTGIETLKLHGQKVTYAITGHTALESLTYKGYAKSTAVAAVDLDVTTVHEDLVSITLGGRLNDVNIDTGADEKSEKDDTALTTIVTSGTIHDLSVSNNWALATLTLGHTADAMNTVAPIISIVDNRNLGGFTTSVTKISSLTVTDNYKLTAPDFTSISTLPANYSSSTTTTITIKDNYNDGDERISKLGAAANATTNVIANVGGLKGTYSDTTASAARAYGQSKLATLNGLFTALDAKFSATTGAVASNLVIDITYRYATSATATPADVIIKGTTSGNTLTSGSASTSTNAADITDGKTLLDELLLLQ